MRKPIIGIIGRYNFSESKDDIIRVGDTYRRAVIMSGGIPVMILPTQDLTYSLDKNVEIPKMNSEEKQDFIQQLEMCDGIIVPGGSRIFEYDKLACEYALEKNIPLLGICLGMQTMGAVDCEPEKVVRLIDNGVNHKSTDKFVHDVCVKEDSKLYSLVKNNKFKVNSIHKCNVTATNNADIVAYSEDKIIEAIEFKNKKFAIGLQWHPEKIMDESVEARRLFEAFIEVCVK